ncbi:MAG TPA: 3-dehydroquinate synthase [Chloroflexota bacterium]|nr:3-dehydroquinate synthase [Chloroflexota bacterium]
MSIASGEAVGRGPAAFEVRTASRTYPVVVGPDVLDTLPAWLERVGLRGRLWLIADAAVYALYGDRVAAALRAAGRDVRACTVPSGEEHKTLGQAAELYDWLLGERVERRDAILALGGGVVGDMAGFVAATILRGIAFVQLPTTLLAQVDASIGGKVAVDHPRGKNLIGAFHQPSLVVADTGALATLPPRELAAGWAEVIKTGVILDAELFALLEREADALREARPGPTEAAIRRCMQLKGEVVGEDERESGRRAILNYGHTIGHAIEAATAYGRYLHGEAVAIGLRAAAHIAVATGRFSAEAAARQAALVARFGLPASAPGVDRAAVRAAMGLDKKAQAGRLAWVLPTRLGHADVFRDVPEPVVEAALDLVLADG